MEENMRKIEPINLMKGLDIQFADDGTWLAFKDAKGSSQVIRLENIPEVSGRINNTIIQRWSIERREEHNAQPASAAKPPRISKLDQHRFVCEQCWTNAETGYLELCTVGEKIRLDETSAPPPAEELEALILAHLQNACYIPEKEEQIITHTMSVLIRARERELLERCELAEGVAKKQSHSIAKLDNQLQSLLEKLEGLVDRWDTAQIEFNNLGEPERAEEAGNSADELRALLASHWPA